MKNYEEKRNLAIRRKAQNRKNKIPISQLCDISINRENLNIDDGNNSWYIEDENIILYKCQCKENNIKTVNPKRFVNFINQIIRCNAFYCANCYYSSIKDKSQPIYYTDEAERRRNVDYKDMYTKSKIVMDSYRAKDKDGNYIDNSEKAIEFRRKEHEKCVKIAKNTNQKIWHDPKYKESKLNSLNALKEGNRKEIEWSKRNENGEFIINTQEAINYRKNS